MKLLRLRLHPFGGMADRTCEFHAGLNVLEGPNEFGKSTLMNALWHVLFTPSDLTNNNLRKTLGRWLPQPGGDHARVTLMFESGGRPWTLEKRWGLGACSSLGASGEAAVLADSTRVQERLAVLLQRNEATWRQVLFVNQAALNHTAAGIRENHGDLDDLAPLLAGVARLPGDVPAGKLAEAHEARILGHFGRWDRAARGPEKGRGIDNPWANKVGPLLHSFYERERVRREVEKVLEHERQLDEANGRIRDQEASLAEHRAFVETGRGLRNGLLRRGVCELQIAKLEGERVALDGVLVKWPGAAQVVQAKQSELQANETTLGTLETELGHARKRESSTQTKAAHEKLEKSRNDWQGAADRLKQSKPIPSEVLAELGGLRDSLDRLRIQIAAQKLSARLESRAPFHVTVIPGTGEPSVVELGPDSPWEGSAEGSIRIEAGDLRIDVGSGTGEVRTLIGELSVQTARQRDLLASLGLGSVEAVQAAAAAHEDRVREERENRKIYEAALQGKSEQEWATDIAALNALPATRSVADIDKEREKLRERKVQLQNEVAQLQQLILQWTEDHQDIPSLTTKIVAKATDLTAARSELDNLPQLPEGFDSAQAYLDELNRREGLFENATTALNEARQAHARLSGITPERTAEELSAELDLREREFLRQEELGEALHRIRTKLEQLIADRGAADPLQGLTDSVSSRFRELTAGRYERVGLEDAAPVAVHGAHELDPDLLSRGTAGALALALRCALAEIYLRGLEGFLILDDPFTDMDPARRQAAARCLGEFARDRQVVFFTCHPAHARELEDLAGGLTPAIAG